MVNKAVVGVIGVILITTLGVGALVGLQGGGGPADDATTSTNDNGDNGENPAPNANETAANETAANATATPVPEQTRTAIPGREFTENEIAANLTERINDWREAEGIDRLRATGTTAENLAEMAKGHSIAMADNGALTHKIGNQSTSDRYRANDLYYTCMYKSPERERASYQPNEEFEALAETVAGDTYRTGNGTAFNEDEEAVAGALLAEFQASNESTERILEPGQTKVGVGVEVTRDGAAYATVNLCGG